MITFALEGDELRFTINNAAATASRLKISTRLLSLAKSVKPCPHKPCPD
jgi:hypothetical protein